MKKELMALCTCVALFSVTSMRGHTHDEMNAVIGEALSRAASYYDDLPEGLPPDDNPPPDTWRGFLGADTSGWTFACEEFNYTNAAPAMKALALNPRGIERDEAIGLAVKFSAVDAATTEFVETIITNVNGYSSGERVECYWEYAKKLRQDPCTNGVCASALSMFYRNRKVSGTGAATLDRLFADKIEGYAQSSNRLDTAMSMLTVTNMRPQFVEYFTGVTNQLLSSGQPLPWIEVGNGGN